jgi:hypothetical protein
MGQTMKAPKAFRCPIATTINVIGVIPALVSGGDHD